MKNFKIYLTIIIVVVLLIALAVILYIWQKPTTQIRNIINNIFQQDQKQQNNNNQTTNSETKPKNLIILDGPCSYNIINGSCKITSIVKTLESKQQKSSAGYEGFYIKFSFSAGSSADMTEKAREILAPNKSYSLQLINTWYPGPLFLSKYNIKENDIFDCQALIISKGTCPLVIFKFNEINLSDYFESQK